MLHSISWTLFSKVMLSITALYYIAVFALFFRKETWTFLGRLKSRVLPLFFIFPPGIMLPGSRLRAQTPDANNGINQANTLVRGYFDTSAQLLYAVGAVAGLIGAYKVYKHLHDGHRQDAVGAAANWFGGCIFLVVVATIIKAFFGL